MPEKKKLVVGVSDRDKKAAAEAAAAKAAAAKKASANKGAGKRAAAALKTRVQQHALKAAAAPKKGVVLARSLHIRKDHSATSESVGGLVKGDEVSILRTWTDGKDTWANLGPGRWAALVYKGETYIRLGIAQGK